MLAITADLLFAQVDVLTAQYNSSRTGSNMQETILNQTNVNSLQFGKLFSRTVDAGFYASPLIASGVTVPNVGPRNVVYVATLANTVYAFDADDPAVVTPYWSVNLGPAVLRSGYYLGPTVGILSTPVIDRSSNTIYLTAIVGTTDPGLYVYALDLSTGALKFNAPRRISYTFPSGVTLTVASQSGGSSWIQRAGLLLANGLLYVATSNVWEHLGSIESQEGFIQSFRANDLSVRLGSFETTPSGLGGGIWQAGRGIAADPSGNVFVAMDSGDYSPPLSFGDSIVKFSPETLSPLSWFTPANWRFLYTENLDLSANGVTLMPGTGLAFAGGKTGVIYLLDQANLGGLETATGSGPLQQFQAAAGCAANCGKHLSTAFWPHATNPRLYVWDVEDYLRAYPFDSALQRFLPENGTVGHLLPARPGGLSISSDGITAGTGIVWATTAALDPFSARVPGTLRAYSADDITQELYNSDENSCRDAMGSFVKMAPPIVANGKVYVNTQSNVLNVYGQLPIGPSGTVQVRADTSPSGLAVTVDGSACAASSGPPGSPHTIATVSPQPGNPGTQFVWNNWSDGGAISHAVTPTINTTYTANFTTQYLLSIVASGGVVATSPVSSTGYYDADVPVQLTATATSAGCSFAAWGGAVGGTQNPRMVTLSSPLSVTAYFQCPTSADGSMVPPLTQLVDASGNTWTLGGSGQTLRNGAQAGGGVGSILLWYGGAIYTRGTDNNWWQWNGNGWLKFGPTQPGPPSGPPPPNPPGPSADGAMAPPLTQLVDASGNTWTLGGSGQTLRNGAQAGGGVGSILLWYGGAIYTRGTDNNWWQWSGNGWLKFGPTQPGPPSGPPPPNPPGTSADGAMAPPLTQLVDASGNTWTLGLSGQTLRNGAQAGGGVGSILLWYGGAIYTRGTDGNWWQWNATTGAWLRLGLRQPGT